MSTPLKFLSVAHSLSIGNDVEPDEMWGSELSNNVPVFDFKAATSSVQHQVSLSCYYDILIITAYVQSTDDSSSKSDYLTVLLKLTIQGMD